MKTFSDTFIKKHSSFKKYFILLFLLVIPLLLNSCLDDKSVELKVDSEKTDNGLMVVYPNSGNKLTIVDCNTFEIVKTIFVDTKDNLQILRMCLSSNKDYFILCASSGPPFYSNYIISYNIAKDSVQNIFPTGLDSVSAPRLTAAFIPEKPNLIYLYSHNLGLYSIDFIKKDVHLISSEYSMPKEFYHSPNKRWILISKYFPGYENDYTELQFYMANDGLYQVDFILNKNDLDSLNIKDLEISYDNKHLYVSYLLSQRRAVYQAAYLGSYNLDTKGKKSSHVMLPWSENPYYITYSAKRKEVYMVGAQDKFYVIDVSSEDYLIKTVIDLPGKIPSPSRILIRPDEKVAFVSCVYSNFVIAIDLDKNSILKKISIEAPYLMLLL